MGAVTAWLSAKRRAVAAPGELNGFAVTEVS